MIWLIVIFILIVIAQLCRSLVHVLLHHYQSFDEKFNADDVWFDPAISYRNKYVTKWTITLFGLFIAKFNIPVQASDALHFFNTVELGARDSAIAIPVCLWMNLDWLGCLITFAIIITTDVIFFNLGYDKLWR